MASDTRPYRLGRDRHYLVGSMPQGETPRSGGAATDLGPVPMVDMTRVLVVDDDVLVAEGIASLLSHDGFDVVAISGSVTEALALARSTNPAVILADVMLAGEPEGLQLPGLLTHAGLPIPVIFVSSYSLPHFIERAHEVGGRGFLPKSAHPDQLIAVIEGAVAGMESFPVLDGQAPRAPTHREQDVLELVATGLTHHEVAGRLAISNRTVDGHIQRMYGRYEVDSCSALLALALRMGWIAPLAIARSHQSAGRSTR